MKKYIIAALFTLTLIAAAYFTLPNFRTSLPYDAGTTALVIGSDRIEEKFNPIIENGEILLPMTIIKKYIDPKALWDENVKKLVFTTAEKVVTMKTDNLTAKINSKPVELNIPAKVVDGEPYVPIQFIGELMKIDVKWNEKNNVVIIDHKTAEVQTAEVLTNKAVIREQESFWSPKLAGKILKGDTLRVFEAGEKWVKIRTQDGVIGYVEKKNINLKSQIISSVVTPHDSQASWKPETGKINLVWEAVYSKNPDTSKMNKIDGLDVVSPTWFAVSNSSGEVSNLADMKYVNWAHKNGYKVWGLVTNSFDPKITHEFLNNTDTREKIIQQLLIYAQLYQLDGINIDFENIYMKDKDMLTQFVRELTPLLHEQGLTVSMDVTTKSLSANWSLCYDRKALAQSADYVSLMAYDQYYSASPVAGSVAQLTWVENNIKSVLSEIPSEKLLLGLPFYMREWKEEVVNGKVSVSSKTLSMESAKKIIDEKKPKIVWDEISGQYFAEYMEGNTKYKIWIEEERSINLKSSLALKYNLAGVAAWRRGFESEQIWAVLQSNMKNMQNYTQWANTNSDENMATK